MRAILSLLFIVTFETHAAKPTITAITGASVGTLTSPFTAFGGLGGTACSNPDENLTCDSCTGQTTLGACNPTRIWDFLKLRIAATKTDAGNLILIKSSTTDGLTTRISTPPHNPSDVSVYWRDVCINLGNATGCEGATAKTGNLRVCIDKNNNDAFDTGEECEDVQVRLVTTETADFGSNTAGAQAGLYDFVPYPGDEKIYIEDPLTVSSFPSVTGMGLIKGITVYIGENNMTEAAPGKGLEPVALALVDNGAALSDSKVDGLTNGKVYWFRTALRDEANNLGYFWPPVGGAGGFTDKDGKDCDSSECQYSATPDQVVGLLTEDMNCFIASAAYGTSFNDKLDTFREFRFKRLLPTEWGRKFVKFYYGYGPYAARFIHDKPAMRALARGVLWPAYGFSRLALNFGLWPATLIALFATALGLALPLYGVRRFISRA